MSVITKELSYSSKGNTDIIDITNDIEQLVSKEKINNGLVGVFIVGSTAGITTIEYENGLIRDFKQMFERLIPHDIKYVHNAKWQDGNGHSHIRASLLGSSRIFPLVNGRLHLGTWQQIVLVDFDNRPRSRKVVIQIMGE